MPTRFEETNCTVELDQTRHYFYAVCHAGNCGWIGPDRITKSLAKRDAVRHHKATEGQWA